MFGVYISITCFKTISADTGKKLDILFYIIGGISIAPAIILPSFSYQIPITFIIMGFFQDDNDSWYCAETPPLAPFIGFIFTSGISWWKIPVVYFLLMLSIGVVGVVYLIFRGLFSLIRLKSIDDRSEVLNVFN